MNALDKLNLFEQGIIQFYEITASLLIERETNPTQPKVIEIPS